MNKHGVNTSIKLNRFFFICGICMLVSELWKQWYLTFCINGGVYQWWYVPFQLCSIAMYVVLLIPWIHNIHVRPALLTFLMCYSLLGGISVFADTSGLQYPTLPLTLHSYMWHIMLIVVGVCAGFVNIAEWLEAYDKTMSPSKTLPLGWFWGSTLFYIVCCILASLINVIAGKYGLINMFYINPRYKMQQIGFSALVDSFGNTAAILSYVAGTVLGSGLLFYVWRAVLRLRKVHEE